MTLSVREIQTEDVESILNYWFTADEDFLLAMGVDPNLMPHPSDFREMLHRQITSDYPDKKAYCLIWLDDGKAVGHCNVNPIDFGNEAWMHLHMWRNTDRRKGLGSEFVKLSIPHFFEKLKLKKLISMPYSLNPAPNHTLKKVGFTFIEEQLTRPGGINFEQRVNIWELISPLSSPE